LFVFAGDISKMSIALVGTDVAAYLLTPNGRDGFPGLGQAYNLLGYWKDITIDFELSHTDVTPSAQQLKAQRMTRFHWTATLSHLVESGGTYLSYALTNGQPNLKIVFQEELAGGWFTLMGGIVKAQYKRGENEGMETLNVENKGPIGNTGASAWYNYGNPVLTTDQAAQTSVATTQSTGSAPTPFSVAAVLSAIPGGFRGF
jgi:hypothetical protein